MAYNLATAALATGVNKSTILRAIKAGRVSATRDETGWTIEVAELHRVFAPLPAAATGEQPAVPQEATTDALVGLLRGQLDDMRGQLADLRQDRDHWREAFQTAQRQLPPPVYQYATDEQPTATTSPAIITPAERPSRLRRAWRWMRATG